MPEPKEPIEPPPTRTVDEARQDKATNREERVKLGKIPPRRIEQKPTAPVKKSKK
jgi:hypothetical protein